MRKFINEATENIICEDVMSKFDFFDEQIIRDYIIESYGITNEAFIGNIISKVKSGIGQVAGQMKDWVIKKISELKAKFGATRVVPYIESSGGKKVYRFFVRKTKNQCLFSTDSGLGIVGYYFDPSQNMGTVVFRDVNKINREIQSSVKLAGANESLFGRIASSLLFEADDEDDDTISTTAADDKNFRKSIGSEFEIGVDDEVGRSVGSSISDISADLVSMLGKDKAKKSIETPVIGTAQYVENTNIVSIRELKSLVSSLMAQAIVNADASNPPRMYIAGPPGTGKTQIVESFAGSPARYLDVDTGKIVETGKNWELHILEVDKLFPEIFAGFPVEEMVPVLNKISSERTPQEQDKVDQLSSSVGAKRTRLNSTAKNANEGDYQDMSQVEYEKRIRLLQTDLLPPTGDDGYHLFFFDELNRGSPEKIGAVMNLLYQGKVGSAYRIPKNSVMIAAGNVGDGKIDFEKVKQLFGTFYTRMQHVVTTNYDWSERTRFGREAMGPKTYGVATTDKKGNAISMKATVDMGNRDPAIVTLWVQSMIDKYGNSFSYKLSQLNPNDPAYSLDYRVVSNISHKMKQLALQDWYSDKVEDIDVGGFDKEHYEGLFDKLDSKFKTPITAVQKYKDGGSLEYQTSKWASPQQIYMTANAKYYFKMAFRDSFSNSPKADSLLNVGLKAFDETMGSALRISKDDVKYTLALHCLDEKFLSMAESGEGGDAIQKFVQEIRNVIITTKTGTNFWKEAKAHQSDLENKIKELVKEADGKTPALKILRNVLTRDNDDDKGMLLFAANLQVLFERMKTGGTGKVVKKNGLDNVRKDYMREVADEIDRATEDAAKLPDEADRKSVELFVDTINKLLSKVDTTFAATRGANYKYRTIGDVSPDSTGTPASFMIMGYLLRKNKNAYLTPTWARDIAMKVQNKYSDGSMKPPAVIRVEDFLTSEVINSNYEEHLMNGPVQMANYSEEDIAKMKNSKVDDSFGKTDLNQLDMMRISDIANSMNVIERAEIAARKKLSLTTPQAEVAKESIDSKDMQIVESNMRKLFKSL